MISIDVNCSVTEPMRNFVCGVFGICHSMLANPYPLTTSGFPPLANSTVP